MRRPFHVSITLLCFCLTIAFQPRSGRAEDGSRQAEIDKLLSMVYENPSNPAVETEITERLKKLHSADASVRESAVLFLIALFDQTSADQSSGAAKWHATPFWGGGAENSAAEVRKRMMRKISQHAPPIDATAPLILWALEKDPSSDNLKAVLSLLEKVRGTQSVSSCGSFEENLYRTLLTDHRRFLRVVEQTITQATDRRMNCLAPEIGRYTQDYRTGVREAARKAVAAFGEPTNPTFRPQSAFIPELERTLTDIPSMLAYKIPADDTFKRVTKTNRFQDRSFTYHIDGWVLAADKTSISVLDLFGAKTAIEANDTTIAPLSLSAEARELVDARKELKAGASVPSRLDSYERTHKLEELFSRRGGLTAQFESGWLSMPEAILASVFFSKNDRGTAAALLFPALSEMPDEKLLTTTLRDQLGNTYHQEMLTRFQNRDYAEATLLAEHLSKNYFDGFGYQSRAKQFAEQLPARADDFKTFVLPASDEWSKQRAEMTAEQQAAFLASRLRLMNCFQHGQPGGLRFEDTQYATRPADGKKEDPVINPYVELKSLVDSPARIPLLVPYLTDENFTLSVSYWRDFHPGRSVPQVKDLVASIMNEAAQFKLIDLGEYTRGDPEQRSVIEATILEWAKSHSHMSASDIALENMEKTSDRNEFRGLADKLAKAKEIRVLELIERRVDDFDAYVKGDLARLVYEFDAPEAVALAGRWLARPLPPTPEPTPSDWRQARETAGQRQKASDLYSGAQTVQIFAAATMLSGDRSERTIALKALSGFLDHNGSKVPYSVERSLKAIVQKLLSIEDPGAKSVACRLGSDLGSNRDKLSTVRILFKAGCRSALDAIISELSQDPSNSGARSSFMQDGKEVTVPVGPSDYLTESLIGSSWHRADGTKSRDHADWAPPGFAYDRQEPVDVRNEKRRVLIKWLEDLFARIERGEHVVLSDPRPHDR